MSLHSNPFDETSFSSSDNQYTSFPICLDSENQQKTSYRTPISRFSQTNQSSVQTDHGTAHFFPQNKNLNEKNSTVTITQQQLSQLYAMHQNFINLKSQVKILQKRNEQMAITLEKQRIRNNHLEQAFSILKKQDHNLSHQIAEKSQNIVELNQSLQQTNKQYQKTIQQLEASQSENTYLKQLILIANKNYEKLQQKYQEFNTQNKQKQKKFIIKQKQMHENMQQLGEIIKSLSSSKQNFEFNLLNLDKKGQKTWNKQNCKKAPSQYGSVKNVKSPANKDVEDAYRKFFVKTLKNNGNTKK